MSKIIDGLALAQRHEQNLRDKLSRIKHGRAPSVVSFCNQDDPPSVKYTYMKLKKATDLGIDFLAEDFSAKTSHQELKELVTKYNNDQEIDGVMVQLPMPFELNSFKKEIIELIDPKKDVDGLKEDGEKYFLAATAKAVISLIDEGVSDWENKKIAVIGATGEVGNSLVEYLENKKNMSVIKVSRSVGNINEDLKLADIVVSATGSKDLVKPEMIKEGVVLIDVGLGDFDPKCYEKASKYTPIIGGVGPMTVISLMENVVESHEQRR